MATSCPGTGKRKEVCAQQQSILLSAPIVFRKRKEPRSLLPFVVCVTAAAVTLLFFIEYITREAVYGRLLQVYTAATATAGPATAANITGASFNELPPPTEENSTEGTASLPCRRPGLRILYFVHTAPQNVKKRMWLRKTIGDPKIEAFMNSAIVFFVGVAPDPKERRLVEEEVARERDFVLLNFADTYRNLSLKFIQGAKWIKDNCLLKSNTTIVKMDDDVLVNVFALSSYVDSLAMRHNGIHCYLFTKEGPKRTRNSKWRVSKEEYVFDKYPAYCAGAAYILRSAVLYKLYEASTRVPVFWVDDVYVTGILASLTKVDMVDIRRYIVLHAAGSMRTVETTLLFVHTGPPSRISHKLDELWFSVLSRNESMHQRHWRMAKVRHRKTLPWLVDWVLRRTGNTSFSNSIMK